MNAKMCGDLEIDPSLTKERNHIPRYGLYEGKFLPFS